MHGVTLSLVFGGCLLGVEFPAWVPKGPDDSAGWGNDVGEPCSD